MGSNHSTRAIALSAISIGIIAVLAGCTSTGGGGEDDAADSGQKLTILSVNGPVIDPFFGAMKKGSEDAASDLGVNFEYLAGTNANDYVNEYTRLAETAVSRDVDALVFNNFLPDAFGPRIEQATSKGIPVVIVNSGQATWQDVGAITYIGEDPYVVGQQAGQLQADAGVKKGLCVNHNPANPALEQRCTGYTEKIEAAGGSVSNLNIRAEDSTDDQKITAAITGALRADTTIDGIFTLGSAIATDAVNAAETAGIDPVIGTTDISTLALQAVKDGGLDFILDQQPYLQGYYSVLAAYQFARYGLHPVGQVNTAPNVITQDNVDRVLEINSAHPGVLGAN